MAKENRIPLRGWLTQGKHDALIEKWRTLQKGEQQYAILRGLELFFSLPPSQRTEPIRQLAGEVMSMRRMLDDLPEEIADVIKALLVESLANLPTAPPDVPPEPERRTVTPEDLERRRANRILSMKKFD
jgi:hypothetical protein